MTATVVFQVLAAIAAIALILKFSEKFFRWAFQFRLTWYLILGGAVYAIYHFWGGQAAFYAVLAYVLYVIYLKW